MTGLGLAEAPQPLAAKAENPCAEGGVLLQARDEVRVPEQLDGLGPVLGDGEGVAKVPGLPVAGATDVDIVGGGAEVDDGGRSGRSTSDGRGQLMPPW